MSFYWWILTVAVVLSALGIAAWSIRRSVRRATPSAQAKQRFHVHRERLEAKFIQLASAHATPDAPQWTDCIFDDDVAYVRSRTTGELSAFVAVTIAAENSGGAGGTSDVVGNLGRHRGLPLRSRPLGDRRPRDSQPQPERGGAAFPQRSGIR